MNRGRKIGRKEELRRMEAKEKGRRKKRSR